MIGYRPIRQLTHWAAVAALGVPAVVRAQRAVQTWQPEARIEALTGRTTAWQVAAGANMFADTYVRVGLLAAAGARRDASAWHPSARLDAVVRFQVDPFREFPVGLYAGGGVSVLADQGPGVRGRLLVVAGYEGKATRRGWIFGSEAGLGGGVRLGMTVRRARPHAR